MTTVAAEEEYDVTPNEDGITLPSIATSLPNNGDANGVRKWLNDHGIAYAFVYTNDVLSNVSGGNRRGAIDQGKLEGRLLIDFGKLAGLDGLRLYANAFQIHNTGRIRRDYVGGINTIAAIEAVPATRLSELWLEQKFAGGKASLRAGQLTADSEFFYSETGEDLFLQSDWPTIAAVNMPSGGPAYPLSTPGVRAKFEATPNLTFLFALFNGDPAGPGPGDEQLRNRYGLNFRVSDPPLLITETQWRSNRGEGDTGLARTIKLGGWFHLGRLNDQRLANDGSLLANPAGSGIPLQRRGDSGVYAVIDQQLYRLPGGQPTAAFPCSAASRRVRLTATWSISTSMAESCLRASSRTARATISAPA